MSMAPQELENSASKYAGEAIKADSQGAYGMAISGYQNASTTLIKLIRLYPDSKLNQVYTERIRAYQGRVKELQNTRAGNIEPVVDPNSSPEEQKKSLARAQPKSDDSMEDLILKEKPDVKWNEVIGLDDAKNALRESIVYPSKRPDLFPLGWARGMLLYGPPGTGKTMLAAATAHELDGYFIVVDAASMMSKWLGEAEKNVSKLFMMYVIGATNKPWSLDSPFLRRFQKRIYVSLPSTAAREKLFDLYTSPLRKNPRVNSLTLAKQFDGYSASDIRDVCQGAQLQIVNELFKSPDYHEPIAGEISSQPRELTMMDFKNIKIKRRPSVSTEMVRAYHKWSEQFGAL